MTAYVRADAAHIKPHLDALPDWVGGADRALIARHIMEVKRRKRTLDTLKRIAALRRKLRRAQVTPTF